MGGLSNLGSAHIQGEFNKQQANTANKITQRMQQRDMKFQREMRGTMYQDMVKDLREAGLNPILAYQKQGIGGSASGGAASAASMSMPQGSDFNPTDVFSAKQMSSDASLKDDQKKTEADRRELLDAETSKAEFEADLKRQEAIQEAIFTQAAVNNPNAYLFLRGQSAAKAGADILGSVVSGGAKLISKGANFFKKPVPKVKTTQRQGTQGGKRVDYTETVTE